MKILFLIPEFSGYGGGIITFYRTLATELAANGCTVRVLEGSGFMASDKVGPQVVAGVEVEKLESARLYRHIQALPHLAPMPELRRLVAAAWAMNEQASTGASYDVVEASDFGLLNLAPIIAGSTAVVSQAHGSYGQINRYDPMPGRAMDAAAALSLETWLMSESNRAQSSSNANCRYWSQQSGRGIDRILPVFVPPDADEDGPIMRQVSVFGRIQRWKGPYVLCEALKILPHLGNIIWHGRDIVASPEEPSTDALLRRLYPGIWGGRIRVRTPLPPSEVSRIQASSLLNLVPSTWDVFNFTVVEAMSSGRPVVCASGAGASELIEDGCTGFVYDGTSSEALAATLDRALATSDSRLREIGRAARAHVTHELNPKKIVAQRIAAYEQAIQSHTSSSRNIPDWVQAFVMPQVSGDNDMTFLSQLPLRGLAHHIGGRLAKKIGEWL